MQNAWFGCGGAWPVNHGSIRARGEFVSLWQCIGDDVPGSFRSGEDVLLGANAGIFIEATRRNANKIPPANPRHRSTLGTKAAFETSRGFINRDRLRA
jgi:hypothetical protein